MLIKTILSNSDSIDNVFNPSNADTHVSTFNQSNQINIMSSNTNSNICGKDNYNKLNFQSISKPEKRKLTIEEELEKIQKKRESESINNPILSAIRSTVISKELSINKNSNNINNNNSISNTGNSIFKFDSSKIQQNVFSSSQSFIPTRQVSSLSKKTDGLFKYTLPAKNSQNIINIASLTPSQVREQHKSFKMVGKALIDSTNLMKYAPKPEQEVLKLMPTTNSSSSNKILQQEIDSLLSRKSINTEEEDCQWFEEYSKKLNKLSQREFMEEKISQLHHINVKAFQVVHNYWNQIYINKIICYLVIV